MFLQSHCKLYKCKDRSLKFSLEDTANHNCKFKGTWKSVVECKKHTLNLPGIYLFCSISIIFKLKKIASKYRFFYFFLFSCEYCEISKNTYFEEHLRTAVSPETTCVLVQLQILCYEQYDFCESLLLLNMLIL